MHHDSSSRKLSRSCSSASASSHSIWQTNLKSRKEVEVIWQTNGNDLPFRQIWRHFRSSYFSVDVGTATTTTTPAMSTTVPTHVTYTLACEERRSGGGWLAG
ncbi:unnamed protein product [Sphagnum tenellum]